MVSSVKTTAKYFFDPHIIKIDCDSKTWHPTPHGYALAFGMVKASHIFQGNSIIEIGAGTGIHSILALKLGAKNIDITEIDEHYLTIAKQNAQKNNVSFRYTWVKDWMNFTPEQRYDVVLCNPPFCKAGKANRRWFITELIERAHTFLNPGGHIIFCQSSMANFAKTEQELQANNFSFEVVHRSRGIFRDYYFTEPGFIEESRQVSDGFEIIEDEYIETLQVYLGTLKV